MNLVSFLCLEAHDGTKFMYSVGKDTVIRILPDKIKYKINGLRMGMFETIITIISIQSIARGLPTKLTQYIKKTKIKGLALAIFSATTGFALGYKLGYKDKYDPHEECFLKEISDTAFWRDIWTQKHEKEERKKWEEIMWKR